LICVGGGEGYTGYYDVLSGGSPEEPNVVIDDEDLNFMLREPGLIIGEKGLYSSDCGRFIRSIN
jgi:hypothetical protein